MVTPNPLNRLQTKLGPPPLPAEFLARPQLVKHLAQAVTHPVTLLAAPAGSGKTMLAGNWLDQAGTPTSWLTLDAGDNRLPSFLYYLVAAIQKQFLDACPTTGLILHLPEPPPFSFVAANLINELADLPQPLILVLDNFHLIHDVEVTQLVQALVENQPATIHLLILTRGEPDLPLPRLRARQQIAEIGPELLAFDAQEAQAYLELAADRPVASQMAALLSEWSEGWIMGLQLAGAALREETASDHLFPPAEAAIQEALLDYFSSEVLAGHAEPARQFMLQIASLERFSAPLCDAVLAGSSEQDSRTYLKELRRRGSFLLPAEDRAGWYRFHRLFRQTLQQIGEEVLDGASARALHARASDWLAANGYIEEAIDRALAAGDAGAAARIVEERARGALQREDLAALNAWLERLPPDLIRQRPALLLAQAWQQQLYYLRPALDYLLEPAENLLETGETSAEAEELKAEILALRSSDCYWRGEYKEAEHFAQAALARLAEDHPAASHAQAYLALTQYVTRDPGQALQQLKHTFQHHPPGAITNLSPLLLAQAHLSLYSARLHQLTDGATTILNYGRRLRLPLTTAWGHYFLGRAHYEWDRLDHAAEHFSAVLAAGPSVAVEARADSLLALALIHQAQGELEGSLAAVTSLEGMGEAQAVQAAACRARLALLQGDTAAALDWVETTATPQAADYLFSCESPLLIRIRVLMARKSPDSLREAIRLLVPALQAAQTSHNRLAVVKVLALRALALQAQGRIETAVEVLDRAVRMGRRGGMVRAFVDLGLPMADLLSSLLRQQEHEDGYARQLLEAFARDTGIVHPLAAAANEALIEPLTERELEVLQMLARRLSNQEIAQRLDISPLTVKKHTINIYQKLNVDSRQEAVAAANKLGLIFEL